MHRRATTSRRIIRIRWFCSGSAPWVNAAFYVINISKRFFSAHSRMEYASWIAHSWVWRAKPTEIVGKVSECEVCSAPRIFIGLFSFCQFRCHLHSTFDWNDINFIIIFRRNDPAILPLTLVDAIGLWSFLVRRGSCRIQSGFTSAECFFRQLLFSAISCRFADKDKKHNSSYFVQEKEGKNPKTLMAAIIPEHFVNIDILHLNEYAGWCWYCKQKFAILWKTCSRFDAAAQRELQKSFKAAISLWHLTIEKRKVKVRFSAQRKRK